MKLLLEILICFLAGAGAGIGTGFAGMSAAAVIGPMLVAFLGVPAYEAVGIGLISDVLTSAVSAYTYKKSGNLDIKNSLPMMISTRKSDGQYHADCPDHHRATLYPKTGHNHKGTDECRFCQRATNESDYRRHFRRFYLRICRCWWWNDDAVCTDFFSGISDAHGGWNQCIHHGIYRTYRRNQSFRNRWHARHYDYGPMRRIHTSLG